MDRRRRSRRQSRAHCGLVTSSPVSGKPPAERQSLMDIVTSMVSPTAMFSAVRTTSFSGNA
jgi:hypothetical protein